MLNKLKSLFIIEDKSSKKETKEKESPANLSKDSSSNEPQKLEFDIENDNMEELKTAPNPKFIEVLLQAIEKNNAEGFDYLEFKQSLQSLSKMDMDEKTKYQSAFAMAKTMGITIDRLINSANGYISILKKEDTKFKEALVNQRRKQIEDRKNQLKNLESAIRKKEEEIKKLTIEIDKNRKGLDKKAAEIEKAAQKVHSTEKQFEQAYRIVMGQIVGDLKKMQEFLTK